MPPKQSAEPEEAETINLAPRVPALNGTHLNVLIDLYIEACRLRLDHQVTVDGYEYQLIWFKDWWQGTGPGQSWRLLPDDFMRFEKYLRGATSAATGRQISYNTRHTIIKRLKEMFGWAFEKGYLQRDYGKWVPNAEGGPPKRSAAGIPSLQRLLKAAGEGRQPVRNRAIVAMLMGMGLRRAELSGLNLEKVVVLADHSGHAHVVGKRTRANPTGHRQAAFDSATGKIIVAYLDSQNRASGPMFLGQRGERLTGQGIYKVVKEAIAASSLQAQIVGPHDLRRAFSTHWARNSPGPDSAHRRQRQLGHESYEQTMEYTLLDIDDIRVDLISPLALFPEDDPY